MCFSATASFTAGAAISLVGIAAIKTRQHRAQLLFACIPFIFGIQQLTEGLLWIQLRCHAEGLVAHFATHVFLFFAQVVWPFWVPLSILLLEKREQRSVLQKILVALGGALSLYFIYCQYLYPVDSAIEGKHIVYYREYPSSFDLTTIVIYAVVTILPSFLSHIPRMWILGSSIALSFLITSVFYQHYILSVWCFFAAIISLSIYTILRGLNRKKKSQMKALRL